MVTLPAAAISSTPTLMWSGAKRVNILCNVAGGPGIDHLALSKQLCRHVAKTAARGSPLAIGTIMLGDPAVLAADAVTLLVHASVNGEGRSRVLAFTIRPYRTSAEQTQTLFGAAPRAALLSGDGIGGPHFTAAMGAALSEVLPWQISRKAQLLK